MNVGDIFVLALFFGQLLTFAILYAVYQAAQFNPQDLTDQLQRIDASASAGTARQKKKVDELFGKALLEQTPLVTQLTKWRPDLGEYLQKNPNMISYAHTIAASLITGATQYVPENLKQYLMPIIQQFVGVKLGDQKQAPSQKMPWE